MCLSTVWIRHSIKGIVLCLSVVGGVHNGEYVSWLYCYDPVMDVWARKQDMNTKRAIHALAGMNDRLYAIGGNHLKGKYSSVSENEQKPGQDWYFILRLCERGAGIMSRLWWPLLHYRPIVPLSLIQGTKWKNWDKNWICCCVLCLCIWSAKLNAGIWIGLVNSVHGVQYTNSNWLFTATVSHSAHKCTEICPHSIHIHWLMILAMVRSLGKAGALRYNHTGFRGPERNGERKSKHLVFLTCIYLHI